MLFKTNAKRIIKAMLYNNYSGQEQAASLLGLKKDYFSELVSCDKIVPYEVARRLVSFFGKRSVTVLSPSI